MSDEKSKEQIIVGDSIEVLESLVVRYGDLNISISGDPAGVLLGKTSDQTILFCADVLRQSVGEVSLEESIKVPQALRDTLVNDYGWSDLEYNRFIQVWRRNLYLKKVGADQGVDVDLEEYKRFTTYLEKKKAKELDEIEAGSVTDEDLFVEAVEEAEKVSEEVSKNSESLIKEGDDSFIDGSLKHTENLSDFAASTGEESEAPKIIVGDVEIDATSHKNSNKKLKKNKK